MTDNNDGMARRIQTLLTQAEEFRRHGSDGEADAALARAEAIMIKYSIDAANLASATSNNTRSQFTRIQIDFTGIYRKVLIVGAYHVIDAFGSCRSFQQKLGNVDRLNVVGEDVDTQFMRYIIASLQLQAIQQMNRWWQSHPLRGVLGGMNAYKERRQYVSSFMQGATVRVARAHRDATRGSGVEVVLANQLNTIDEYLSREFNLRTARTRTFSGSQDAATAGFRSGMTANTGDRPIGNVRRELT